MLAPKQRARLEYLEYSAGRGMKDKAAMVIGQLLKQDLPGYGNNAVSQYARPSGGSLALYGFLLVTWRDMNTALEESLRMAMI
jgi:hypothetical protein